MHAFSKTKECRFKGSCFTSVLKLWFTSFLVITCTTWMDTAEVKGLVVIDGLVEKGGQ